MNGSRDSLDYNFVAASEITIVKSWRTVRVVKSLHITEWYVVCIMQTVQFNSNSADGVTRKRWYYNASGINTAACNLAG